MVEAQQIGVKPMIRDIVSIDEEKCDGCGLCVPACHEGAIRIVNGKARLAADVLCDGLGACLGHCPKGAIRIEKREADKFDEQAVAAHLQTMNSASINRPMRTVATAHHSALHAGGCPSQRFNRLASQQTQAAQLPDSNAPCHGQVSGGNPQISQLSQWPVQLRLLPPRAPLFQNADLLLTADCVPFALPDFHHILRGHALAIACPKLDDTGSYVPKLTEIIAANHIKSITVVHMEVPCCTGILMMAMQARQAAGSDIPIEEIVVSIRGEVLYRRSANATDVLR